MAEQPQIVVEGPPQQLEVTIFAAYGLKHLNMTGDAPYCVCEVLHADPRHKKTQVQTQALKGTLDPEWNETFRLDPWCPNEPLEFGIWDKGLMGSKEEGTKIILDSEQFYPNGCEGELPIPGLEDARLHIRIVPVGPSEIEAPWAHESQGPIVAQGPKQKLEVSIISAIGLKHLNMTGDAPYVVCEVNHADRHEKKVSCQTQAIKGTLEPRWNEIFDVDPWRDGEPLTFTVYDKGSLGSKTEGKMTVPSKYFSPHGFEGQVPLEGLEHALLYVRIVPKGDSTVDAAVPTQAAVAPPTQVAVPAPTAYEAQIPTNPALEVPSTTHVPQAYPGAPAAVQLEPPPGGTLLQGNHPAGTLSLATLDNMHELTKKGFGPGKYVGINVGAETGEVLPVEKLGSLQLATPTLYSHASGEPIVLAKDPKTAKPGELQEPPAQKLQVSLLGATGLKHMNMTGDNMYCECKTKPLKPHARSESCTTKPLSKTLEPQWNETHEIDPWHEGEQLEFTVYDRGMIGSKTEGKAVLHPEQFYPHGCEGQLPLEGLEEAGLSVRVVPLGPSTKAAAPHTETAPAQAVVAGAAQPVTYSTGPAYAQAADLFKQLDTNHDGKLSPQEFAQMQSQPAAPQYTMPTYMAPTYKVPQPAVPAPYAMPGYTAMPAAAGAPVLQSTYGQAPAINAAYKMPQAAPAPATPAYARQSYAAPAAGAFMASPSASPFPPLATTYAAPPGEPTAQTARPSSAPMPGYPPMTTTYGAPAVAPAPGAQFAAPAAYACPASPSVAAPGGASVAGPSYAMSASQPSTSFPFPAVPAEPVAAQPYAASPGYPQYAPVQQPMYSAPMQQPAYSVPPAQQPTYAAPTAQQPTYAAPTQQQPTYAAAPTPQQPSYAAPTAQQPMYAAPMPQQPTYAAPTPQQPTYAAPTAQRTYAAPTAQPTYAAPTVQQPTYAAPPAYGQGPTQGTLPTTYGAPPPMMGQLTTTYGAPPASGASAAYGAPTRAAPPQPQMGAASPIAGSFPGMAAYQPCSAAAPSFPSATSPYPPAFGAPAAAPATFSAAPCVAGGFPGGSSAGLFDMIDKNHDGKLSREEFVAAYVRKMQEQGLV